MAARLREMRGADVIPFHPLANIFPLIEGREFEELVADVGANGIHDKIDILDGMILDGRNRYRAALAAGLFAETDVVEPGNVLFIKYFSLFHSDRGDPVAFVISKNLRRRQMNESQRAMAAAKLANIGHGGDRRSDQAANLPVENVPQAAAAEMLNISERSVRAAKGIQHDGVDELNRLVEIGELRISTAALIARLPKEEQVRLLQEAAPHAVKAAAKEINARARETQAQSRHDLAQTLSDTSAQLTGRRKVPCIYADPAVRRKAGIGDRAYENHYPTMEWDDILALPVKDTLLPDAWGFIWLPRAHVLALHPVKYTVAIDDGSLHDVTIKTPLAWAIARAWGFDSFSTMTVWDKTDPEHPDEHGTGLIFWDQCEILCLFKKGRGLPAPIPAQMYGSLIRERARPLGHSAKPAKVRTMIASMVGRDSDNQPLHVLELFARNDPDNPLPENWEAWGNESAAQQPETSEAAE